MLGNVNLKFYVNLGNCKEHNCFCNYYNPQCPKYSTGECIAKVKTHNPYEDIEECYKNESKTYIKKHGRIRSKRV